jgi:molybdopterin-guanine dinucleotide biosynthesis protein A
VSEVEGIRREQITGLVLAGGKGSRMGGVDKGLQLLDGVPLALRALRRIEPQVGACLMNANRHLDQYAAWRAPVCQDAWPDHRGPLAGLLAGLEACRTPWLVSVPCDTPDFPLDLVERLANAVAGEESVLALAETVEEGSSLSPPAQAQAQAVFCLLHIRHAPALRRFLEDGGSSALAWAQTQRNVRVRFSSASNFDNLNTLAALQRRG